MKKCLLLFALLISLSLFSQDGDKRFVGYINNTPVFDAYDEGKLYILKDKPEFLQDYPKKYSAIAVKDDCFVYQDHSRLMVSYKGVESVYDGFSCYAAIGAEGAVYATGKDGFLIKILKDGKVTDTGLKGWPVLVHDGYLYYDAEHDPEIIHANADLYKIGLKTLKNPEKIAVNITGEYTVVYPGGKYVYDHILYGGTFRPVLYSVDNGNYYEIRLTEEFTDCVPFYSYQDKCLVFYNTSTLKMFKLPLPAAFTFVRPADDE